jgi:hypothetical protein
MKKLILVINEGERIKADVQSHKQVKSYLKKNNKRNGI